MEAARCVPFAELTRVIILDLAHQYGRIRRLRNFGISVGGLSCCPAAIGELCTDSCDVSRVRGWAEVGDDPGNADGASKLVRYPLLGYDGTTARLLVYRSLKRQRPIKLAAASEFFRISRPQSERDI